MKCSICSRPASSCINCAFCKEPCCSYNCISLHVLRFHNEPVRKISDDNESFHIEMPTTPKSPYITEGYLSKTISYDPKYDLKNFLNVTENGRRKVLGEGSFAKVYLAMNSIDKKYYAIKHMRKVDIQATSQATTGIKREVEYQSKMHHPNIVGLLNFQETERSYYLVMEYGDSGSLFSYIKKRQFLQEEQAFRYFIQVANAIYFLHSNNFIHRDLKPENMLLFQEHTLKVCDFGWCCNLGEFHGQRSTFCGTTEYMAPELVNKKKYTKEIDIWSMGVLLYEMLHGFSPFSTPYPTYGDQGVIENIKEHNLSFAGNISNECQDIIKRMLDPNAITRIKIEDIFKSDFVKKYEKMGFVLPPKITSKLNSKVKDDLQKTHKISNSSFDNNCKNYPNGMLKNNSANANKCKRNKDNLNIKKRTDLSTNCSFDKIGSISAAPGLKSSSKRNLVNLNGLTNNKDKKINNKNDKIDGGDIIDKNNKKNFNDMNKKKDIKVKTILKEKNPTDSLDKPNYSFQKAKIKNKIDEKYLQNSKKNGLDREVIEPHFKTIVYINNEINKSFHNKSIQEIKENKNLNIKVINDEIKNKPKSNSIYNLDKVKITNNINNVEQINIEGKGNLLLDRKLESLNHKYNKCNTVANYNTLNYNEKKSTDYNRKYKTSAERKQVHYLTENKPNKEYQKLNIKCNIISQFHIEPQTKLRTKSKEPSYINIGSNRKRYGQNNSTISNEFIKNEYNTLTDKTGNLNSIYNIELESNPGQTIDSFLLNNQRNFNYQNNQIKFIRESKKNGVSESYIVSQNSTLPANNIDGGIVKPIFHKVVPANSFKNISA